MFGYLLHSHDCGQVQTLLIVLIIFSMQKPPTEQSKYGFSVCLCVTKYTLLAQWLDASCNVSGTRERVNDTWHTSEVVP